jgi:hypothetical protein
MLKESLLTKGGCGVGGARPRNASGWWGGITEVTDRGDFGDKHGYLWKLQNYHPVDNVCT